LYNLLKKKEVKIA